MDVQGTGRQAGVNLSLFFLRGFRSESAVLSATTLCCLVREFSPPEARSNWIHSTLAEATEATVTVTRYPSL